MTMTMRGIDATTKGGDDDVNETEEVPTVSLELYEGDFNEFVVRLGEAYTKYGFVILENHGIPQEIIERTMGRSRAFFECDEVKKKKYTLRGFGGARGYTAFGVEQAKGASKPGACDRCFGDTYMISCSTTNREMKMR